MIAGGIGWSDIALNVGHLYSRNVERLIVFRVHISTGNF